MSVAPEPRVGALIGVLAALLCVGALTVASTVEASGSADRGGDPALGKCAPRIVELLASPEQPDALILWIFFTDRLCDGFNRPVARRPSQAIGRRLARTHAVYDEHYLPPCADYVERVRPHCLRLRHVSRYFNAVSAVVEPSEIPAICALGFVRSVEEVAVLSAPLEPLPAEYDGSVAARRAGADPAQYGGSFSQLDQIGVISLLEGGYNGSGSVDGGGPVRIGVLDSGFRRDHEALSAVAVEAEWDFVRGDSVTRNEPGDPSTQDSHGTMVLGIIAGHAEGRLVGPAWGARYLLAKTEIINVYDERVEEDNWVAGIEWADTNGADLVTSSLGYVDWYAREDLDGRTAKCTIAAGIAASHGIIVVNSAGNGGLLGLVAPADGEEVFSIGAVDRYGTIASFSSRGPTADGRVKPDFVAMGVASYSVSPTDPHAYVSGNGTSYSAPLFAGACALLLEMHRGWDPAALRAALGASASRSESPDNTYGWGIPNFQLAGGCSAPYVSPAAFPNPFGDATRLRFYSAVPEVVTARVYDCRGALVRTLCSGELRYCAWDLTWDGRADGGAEVGAGVYFAAVTRNVSRSTFKLIRIR